MNIHRSAPRALAFGAIAVLLPAADKSWMPPSDGGGH